MTSFPHEPDPARRTRLYREGVKELHRQLADLRKPSPPGTTRAKHASDILTAIARSSLIKISQIVPRGLQPPDPPYDPQVEFDRVCRWFMSTFSEMLRAEMETPGRISDILISHLALTFWLYVGAERKRLAEEGYSYPHPPRLPDASRYHVQEDHTS